MSLVSALLASAVIASISPSFAAALCRAEGTRYPTKNPVAAGKRIISEAESIVRAVAVRALPDSAAHPLFGPFIRMPLIEFEVREVLKGKGLPRMLHILGHLTDRDDFNRSEVPYSVVRPSGLTGGCVSVQDKRGNEFLLFLQIQSGVLAPYWDIFAPLNEQLRSANDPWLHWVRSHVPRSPKAMRASNPSDLALYRRVHRIAF